mmetsp:Transcript_24739/g.25158  ORF Transcript_24739/g.25158 Transcript_24739/m.25158 type:complete len:84 (+) Transcript_24739:412-663(+)
MNEKNCKQNYAFYKHVIICFKRENKNLSIQELQIFLNGAPFQNESENVLYQSTANSTQSTTFCLVNKTYGAREELNPSIMEQL